MFSIVVALFYIYNDLGTQIPVEFCRNWRKMEEKYRQNSGINRLEKKIDLTYEKPVRK